MEVLIDATRSRRCLPVSSLHVRSTHTHIYTRICDTADRRTEVVPMERIPRVNTFRPASNVYGMQPRSSSLAITHTRVKDLQALNVLDSDE